MFSLSSLGLAARAFGVSTLMVLASACYAEAGAEPAYVDATAAPVDVEVAPQYYYEGRTVYYVNDRWYARDRGRWVYYRTEPAPLARHRVEVQRAPRAPERQTRVIEQPRREQAPRAEPERHDRAEPERHDRAEPERHDKAPRAERERNDNPRRAERVE